MTVLVYRYGVPARIRPAGGGRRAAVQVPAAVMEQIRLGHQLRNDLVALWKTWQEAKVALWGRHPLVGKLDEEILQATEVVSTAHEVVSKANADARSRRRPKSDIDRVLTEARKTLRQLKVARRAAIAAAYEAEPDIPAQMESFTGDYNAGIKALYGVYCQQGRLRDRCAGCDCRFAGDETTCSGCGAGRPRAPKLYWATYNAVCADHQVATKRVAAERAAGRNADMRFHRFDGSGTISVQLQRMHGPDCLCVKHAEKKGVDPDPTRAPVDPPRTPALLASGGGKWANVLQLGPYPPARPDGRQGVHVHGTVKFCVGNGELAEIPVVIHRRIPDGAEICEAQLTVRVNESQPPGQQLRMSIALTVHQPDPQPVTRTNRIAVHVGWRIQPDGSVRVGTWRSEQPLTAPPSLTSVANRTGKRRRDLGGAEPHVVREAVVTGGGTRGELVVPASWLERSGRPDSIRGHRDRDMDVLRAELAEWLDRHPQPGARQGDDELTGDTVRRWKSHLRFTSLAARWSEASPVGDGADTIVERIRTWERRERHLHTFEAGERYQQGARIKDAARKVAAWLADHAGTIIVDNTNLADLRRRPDRGAEDEQPLHPRAADIARARAATVAPGIWRSAIVATALLRALTVVEKSAAGHGRTCPSCRATADPDPRFAESATVVCCACGHSYDQDVATAAALLASPDTEPDTEPGAEPGAVTAAA